MRKIYKIDDSIEKKTQKCYNVKYCKEMELSKRKKRNKILKMKQMRSLHRKRKKKN